MHALRADRGNETGLGCGAPDRQKETEDRRALKRPTEIIKLEEVFLLNEIPLERGLFFSSPGIYPWVGNRSASQFKYGLLRPSLRSRLAMTPKRAIHWIAPTAFFH